MKDLQKHKPARRKPTQERARQTRLLIFETAVRILEKDGLEGLTTNRIAERSGFSVGTIYQYFANKQEILLALAHHEQERVLAEARQLLEAPGERRDEQPRVRELVRTLLHVFGGRQRARRIIAQAALNAQRPLAGGPAAAFTALLMEGTAGVRLGELEAFVLVQSVLGALRGALFRDERLLRQPAFEDALVSLVSGFLHAHAGPVFALQDQPGHLL